MNIKIAQTTQNSWNFIVGKSSLLKKWQISAIIREISNSNLGDREIRSKRVWSLPDYSEELTALYFPLPVLLLHLHMSFFLLTVYWIYFLLSEGNLSLLFHEPIYNEKQSFFCIFSLLAIDTHISHFLEICLSVFIEVRFVFQDTKLIPSSNHVIKNSL